VVVCKFGFSNFVGLGIVVLCMCVFLMGGCVYVFLYVCVRL